MKRLKFQDDENPVAIQSTLFAPTGVTNGSFSPFPPYYRDPEGVRAILADVPDGIGLDLEFSPKTGRPTILGVANNHSCAGLRWDASLCREVIETAKRHRVKLIGHSVISADRPIVEAAAGIKTDLSDWYDTILGHYLCNSDLCKTPGKDEDDDDSGAMGFMNLWTTASLYTDLPQWKICRGRACDGPCPLHEPEWYCAVDAFAAGPATMMRLNADMAGKGIPRGLFDDLMQLADICHRMETQGIKIDREYIAYLEKNFEAKKDELFPYETVNDVQVFKSFNPRSNIQVMGYFSTAGLPLESNNKDHVWKQVERLAKKHGAVREKKAETIDALLELELSEPEENLVKLYQFKDAGKGLSSWFNDKYISDGDFIHPRFIVPGTSMGRLASSRPNFQNIPARGFGALVRRAVVPRHKGLDFVKVDYSQLELRKCLYLAGVDPRDIGADAFKWLVSKADGKFDRAATLMNDTARQAAKSVAHGADYLESFKVIPFRELDTARIKKEIEVGALRVYGRKWMPELKHDWEYRGGLVAFTGVNLGERLFGDKTYESRKKALEIQEDIYFKAFPQLREWHWKILQMIESRGAVQSPTGRYLPLYGTAEEDAKMAAAFFGQGCSADFVQEKMLRFDHEMGIIPLMQVHDELDWEVPSEWSDAKVVDHLHIMIDESHRFPGFVSALKMKRGKSWLESEMRTIFQ